MTSKKTSASDLDKHLGWWLTLEGSAPVQIKQVSITPTGVYYRGNKNLPWSGGIPHNQGVEVRK